MYTKIGIFIGIILLMACNNTRNKTEQIKFISIQSAQEVRLVDSLEAPTGRIDINIKTMDTTTCTTVVRKINATLAEELFNSKKHDLNQAATSFTHAYLQRYKQEYSQLYLEERKRGTPGEWYDHHISIQGKIQVVRSRTVNYRIDFNRKEGGAAETHEIKTICFDAQTGNRLTLDSILNSGYQERLTELLRDDLFKQFNCNSEEELYRKDIGRFTGIYPPDNFMLTEKGISFTYNPHEIAPYDQGIITCLIDYDDLEKWLRPQYQH